MFIAFLFRAKKTCPTLAKEEDNVYFSSMAKPRHESIKYMVIMLIFCATFDHYIITKSMITLK